MATANTTSDLKLKGSPEEQELAKQLFRLFQARGRFFGAGVPIALPLSELTRFMNSQEAAADWSERINAALAASPRVFSRVEIDGDVTFTTTSAGTAPSKVREKVDTHMLSTRLATPEPKRERPARPQRPSSPRSALIIEPDHEPSPWDEYFRQHGISTDSIPSAPSEFISVVQPEDVPQPVAVDEPVADTADVADVVVVADAAVVEEVDTIEVSPLMLEDDVEEAVDPSTLDDDELAAVVRTSLRSEDSVLNWGNLWLAEDRVDRLSRGDLRRIEEFLGEVGGVTTDTDIVQDVLGIRAGTPEFEQARFMTNVRLAREKEFRYIGTDRSGLWTLTNMPALSSTRRRPRDIGQDYRFLVDYPTPDADLEQGVVEHVLSFYEFWLGVLPLDADMQTIMPHPGFGDQQSARIEFEAPQTNETLIAELRFATGNQGGYLIGFEKFFADNLVAGAVITIFSTDDPTRFTLEYFTQSSETRKLLRLDERKSRYSFQATTYFAAVQNEFVITEDRFPRLADSKPLDEKTRRQPDAVVAAMFERVGDQVGSAAEPQWTASFVDLLAAVNVERPIAAAYLRDLLTGGAHPEFSKDDSSEDTFRYTPVAVRL